MLRAAAQGHHTAKPEAQSEPEKVDLLLHHGSDAEWEPVSFRVAQKPGYDVVRKASSDAEPDAILARATPATALR